jgi:light-regulated signal transduction histidine kinase (bacteriophytochrome)
MVLREALANLMVAIAESGATVTRDAMPTVSGDATQLTQLFQNLVGNALKFRGERPPRIHIGAIRKNGQWRFSVADNGIGMEPQYFERVFLVFQRLHTRKQYQGTGIGLAICKKVVERHGGRIWAEAEPGKGATFFFTIPETKKRR